MNQKPKLLALPGYGTNAQIMKMQMGKIHSQLSQIVDIEYLNPEHEIDRSIIDEELNKIIPADQKVYQWAPLNTSVLLDKIRADSNIVGLIGFSMGTYVATQLLRTQDPIIKERIKFVIFFSSNWFVPEKSHVINKSFRIPSFQTISEQDDLLCQSFISTTLFDAPVIVHTKENHRIPRLEGAQLRQLITFVNQNINQKPKL